MAAQNKPPQDLSPDLKQIYDRVMNVQSHGTPTPPAPSTPPQPTPAAQSASMQVGTSATQQTTTQRPSTTSQPFPPQEKEPFLTSTAPPRPLQGTVGVKTFSLGKENKNEAKSTTTPGEKKGLPKALIIALVIIFFAAWIFFWVVFFFNPFA